MRILVLGGNGMLGHRLCRSLFSRIDVWATIRNEPHEYERFNILPRERLIGNVIAEDLSTIKNAIDRVHPNVVVNALGIVKQRNEAKQAIPSILVNSLFPHQLAEICVSNGVRLIHVSTDCVFSGLRGNYSEADNPDPVDLYGRSKLLGELNRTGCLTIRTSIIGWQYTGFSSLLCWFAGQRGRTIKGYRKAIYSGLSTSVLSTLIGDLIETRPDIEGVYHVASAAISKYDLLVELGKALSWDNIKIDVDENFFCDRSLNNTRFNIATGWTPPNWDEMINQLAAEWHDYTAFFSKIDNGSI